MSDTIGYSDSGLDLSEGFKPHTSHWGVFSARLSDGRSRSPALCRRSRSERHHRQLPRRACATSARIAQPMIRRGWLERGPGPDDRRGRDEFVPCQLGQGAGPAGRGTARVRDTHGPGAVFGGSYGWSSAGRFHHAQSQVHRFLNIAHGRLCALGQQLLLGRLLGAAAAHPRPAMKTSPGTTSPGNRSRDHTDIVLAFGGMALKNSMVAGGGISKHVERGAMRNGAPARLRVRAGQPAARRPAGRGRRGMDERRCPAPTRR